MNLNRIRKWTLFILIGLLVGFLISALICIIPAGHRGNIIENHELKVTVYILDSNFSIINASNTLEEANLILNKYNITLNQINLYQLNKTLDESQKNMLFLENNMTLRPIIDYIFNDTSNTSLNIIFLEEKNVSIGGRAAIAGGDFILINTNEPWYENLGWDLAHETGHAMGLSGVYCKWTLMIEGCGPFWPIPAFIKYAGRADFLNESQTQQIENYFKNKKDSYSEPSKTFS